MPLVRGLWATSYTRPFFSDEGYEDWFFSCLSTGGSWASSKKQTGYPTYTTSVADREVLLARAVRGNTDQSAAHDQQVDRITGCVFLDVKSPPELQALPSTIFPSWNAFDLFIVSVPSCLCVSFLLMLILLIGSI